MMKNLFAVSIMAMAAVTSAHAVIVSQDNIVGDGIVSVDVPGTGDNAGKVVISASATDISGKMDKTVADDKNGVIVRNSAGTAMKGTGTDISVSDAGAITVNHATSATSATSANSATTATTATTADTANAVAWANVTGKPSTFAPSSHSHNTGEVTVASGYAPAASADAVAANDTVTVAIGKLEKQIAGKQASGSYVAANTGITASGNTYKIVQYDSKGLVTAGKSLEESDIPALAESKITNLTTDLGAKQTTANIVETTVSGTTHSYDTTLNESNTRYPSMDTTRVMINTAMDSLATSVAGKVDTVQKVGNTVQAKKVMTTDKDGEVVAANVSGSNGIAVTVADSGAVTVGAASTTGAVASGDDKFVVGGTVYTEVRPAQTSNGTGYLGAPASTTTATNLTNLDTALKQIHPNTGQVKIPSGSETSATFASIWVE